MYRWWVYLHVAGAFGFFMAHGVSLFAAFAMRRETDRARIRALLDLSGSSLAVLYVSLALLLTGGIVAGFAGKWWGSGWIWTALLTLIAIMVLMYVLATPFYNRIRIAVGAQTYEQRKKGLPAPAESGDEELAKLLASGRPHLLTVIGIGGLLFILWLMLFKPF